MKGRSGTGVGHRQSIMDSGTFVPPSRNKSCAVNGCNEVRLSRHYCAKHHNAAVGAPTAMGANHVATGGAEEMEQCVWWIIEAMKRGVDALHAATPSSNKAQPPSSTPTLPHTSSSSSSSPSTSSPPVNEYIQSLRPLAEKLLEAIQHPSTDSSASVPSLLPPRGSSLDIFSFAPHAQSPPVTNSSIVSINDHMDVTQSMSMKRNPPQPAGTGLRPSNSDPDLVTAGAPGMTTSASPPSPADTPAGSILPPVAGPIIDIGIHVGPISTRKSSRKKLLPLGFEMVDRSISGKYDADLNRSGNGKSVYMCFQRGEEIAPITMNSVHANGQANNNAASDSTSLDNKPSSSDSSISSNSSSPSSTHPSGLLIPSLKPITSLSLFFRDSFEEPPHAFQSIEKAVTVGGPPNQDANLVPSKDSGRQVYLAFHRGDGAPIYDLSIAYHERNRNEVLPIGYHELKHTPFGNRADLNYATGNLSEINFNSSSSSASNVANQQAVYICFRPHATPVLQSYLPLMADEREMAKAAANEGSAPTGTSTTALTASRLRVHNLYASVLALLTALLYSYDQKMVLHALEGFMKLPSSSIPPVLLNRFIACVCDAAPTFQTYFTTHAHASLLQFLLHVCKTFLPLLSIDSMCKMMDCCFLTRHEDKQHEISEQILAMMIARNERCKPCQCQVDEKRHAATIGMNAVAGGEGHSKPVHVRGKASNGIQGGSSSSALAPAASPASSTDGYSSVTTSTAPMPAVSSIPCSRCQWSQTFNPSSSSSSSAAGGGKVSVETYCRELVLQTVRHLCNAKDVESEVKAFQRFQSVSSREFRTHVSEVTKHLREIDEEQQRHIREAREKQGVAAVVDSRGMRNNNESTTMNSAAASPTPFSPSATSPSSPSESPSGPSSTGVSSLSFYDPRTMIDESERCDLPNPEERMLSAVTILLCKYATEPASFGLTKSETLKRKTHALRLVFYVLHHGVYFFRSTPGGEMLVRRFVCPALMSCCVTDSNLLWRLLLQTFTVLYDQYRSILLIELGVFFDHICLNLLESSSTPFDLKKDILDYFAHILARTPGPPSNLVGLFYNYDNNNHFKNSWKIFERFIAILAKLTEGGEKAKVSSSSGLGGPGSGGVGGGIGAGGSGGGTGAGSAGMNQSGSTSNTKDQTAELIEQQEEALQRQALKLLVHALHMMAQWVGVPGIKRGPDVPAPPLLTDEDEELAAATGAPPPLSPATSNPSSTGPTSSKLSLRRGSRFDTWSFRHALQKREQKTLQEALKLARTEKLKSALQYLKIVDPAYANARNIAHFLFAHSDALDKAEVGDLLGSSGDKFMSDDEYETLRTTYLEHLDFTGLSFDQAVRLFLCESGFRLPGEAQKIDRLLEAFCKGYCRDNPNVFRNHSSAFVVSFALVMLNTDLHDSRLRSGASHRQPMTEQQFINNLRGVDDKHDFPRPFLEGLYRNIAAQAIEWKENKGKNDGGSSNNDERKEYASDADRLDDLRASLRRQYEITIRRGLAFLKNWATHQQGYNETNNTLIVEAMFEVCWYRIISAITLRSDNYRHGDVEMLHVCLEGLAYGSGIAIVLGLPTERQAFSRQLAKITYIERNRDSIRGNNLNLRIVQGEHLKQEWYIPFNLLCEKHPVRACHVVLECASDIKQRINYERRQAKLRQIESEFNHEIILVDPQRTFVKEGILTKLSNSNMNKKQQYMFFLFNDLILYASEGINSKWKCHRVIHLSLCRLEDLRGIQYNDLHAFRIVSPQKSFIVSAPSKEKKLAWLEAIYHHCKIVMAKRRRYVEMAKMKELQGKNAAAAGGGTTHPPLSTPSSVASNASNASSASDVSSDADGQQALLRRYSTFVGQGDSDLFRSTTTTTTTTPSAAAAANSPSPTPSPSLSLSPSPTPPSSSSSSLRSHHCKLCIRPWAMFRRRHRCRWCLDDVCTDCATQKCQLPNGEKRIVNVCDACYGVIKGMVGDNVKILTVCDT